MKTTQIRLVVCPHSDCNSYYGAPSMLPDMTKRFSGPKTENRHEHRAKHGSPEAKTLADCPDCMQAGRGRITRVPVTIMVQVPLWVEGTEPVALPAS